MLLVVVQGQKRHGDGSLQRFCVVFCRASLGGQGCCGEEGGCTCVSWSVGVGVVDVGYGVRRSASCFEWTPLKSLDSVGWNISVRHHPCAI
jgi:hypothetical protein